MPTLVNIAIFLVAMFLSLFIGDFIAMGIGRLGAPIVGWFIGWAVVIVGVYYSFKKIFRKKVSK